MSFALTSNFFTNARGITFADGGGVTWSLNRNTNTITVTGSSGSVLSSVSVLDSITGNGTSGSPLQLSGDVATPGDSFYYGTNASGTKGWYATSTTSPGGSTTQVQFNNSGAFGGSSSLVWDNTHDTLTINGSASHYAVIINGSNTNNTSQGLNVVAGTSASDIALLIESVGLTRLLELTGDGGLQLGNPAGGTKGIGTINVSSGLYVSNVAVPTVGSSPTWTGNHTFSPASGTALAVNGVSGGQSIVVTSANGASTAQVDIVINRAGSTANTVEEGPSLFFNDTTNSTATNIQHSGGQTEIWQFNAGSWGQVAKCTTSHGWTFNQGLGLFGNVPASQSTGWGTPTGGSVENNFAASGSQTMAVCSAAVAQIIAVLKAVGILGA